MKIVIAAIVAYQRVPLFGRLVRLAVKAERRLAFGRAWAPCPYPRRCSDAAIADVAARGLRAVPGILAMLAGTSVGRHSSPSHSGNEIPVC